MGRLPLANSCCATTLVALLAGACQFPAPEDVFEASVGGSVDGVWFPTTLELRLRSGTFDGVYRPTTNGDFTFPGVVVVGEPFEVAVTQPDGQICQVTGGSGVVGVGNTSAVSVACSPVVPVDVRASVPVAWSFDPRMSHQSVSASLLAQEVRFTVVASGADSIAVNDRPAQTNVPTPPLRLADGTNAFTFTINAGGRTGTYDLAWTRGAQSIAQATYMKAPTVPSQARVGSAVAYDGVHLAVGAPYDDTAGPDYGAVYVFRRNGLMWSPEATVTPTTLGLDPSTSLFGFSVAVAGDKLIVGAPGDSTGAPYSGAVYVFFRQEVPSLQWVQARFFKESTPTSSAFINNFGSAVDIDGETLIASAPGSDYAYIFQLTSGAESVVAIRPPSVDIASDTFGYSVAISGDTAVVGDPGESSSGRGIDVPDADSLANRSGAAYVFRRSGGAWNQEAFVKAANADPGDYFGAGVDIHRDTLVVSAYKEASSNQATPDDNTRAGAGAAYVFERNGTTWAQVGYLKAALPDVGDSMTDVRVFGDLVVAGASLEDSALPGVDSDPTNNGSMDTGSIYLFHKGPSGWVQRSYIKASNPSAGDNFGLSGLILSSDLAIVGAPYEDGPAQGIDPPDQGDSAPGSPGENSGAVYVFR